MFSDPAPLGFTCNQQSTLSAYIDGLSLGEAPPTAAGTLLPSGQLQLHNPFTLRFRFRFSASLKGTPRGEARVRAWGGENACQDPMRRWDLAQPVSETFDITCNVKSLAHRGAYYTIWIVAEAQARGVGTGEGILIQPRIELSYVNPKELGSSLPTPGEMTVPDFGRTVPAFSIVGFGVETDPNKTGQAGLIHLAANVDRWPEPNAPKLFDWTVDGREIAGRREQTIGVAGVPGGQHRFCARAHNGAAVTAWACGTADVPMGAGVPQPPRPPGPQSDPSASQTLQPGQTAQVRVDPNQTSALRAQCETFRQYISMVELTGGAKVLDIINRVGTVAPDTGAGLRAAAYLRVMAVCGKVLSSPAAKAYEGAQTVAGGGMRAKAAGPDFDIEVPEGAVGVRVPDGSSCQLRTPAATISAPRRAEFVVMHNPKTQETLLVGQSGVIAITPNDLVQHGVPADKASFPIKAGDSIRVGVNGVR